MINEVVKGTDDEIEFQGFKGRYFIRLIKMVISLLILTFLFYGFGFSSLWLFLFMFGLGTIGFFYIRHEMDVNKKFGHIHKQHSPPSAIIQNTKFSKFIRK